jgi:hypothetical protein
MTRRFGITGNGRYQKYAARGLLTILLFLIAVLVPVDLVLKPARYTGEAVLPVALYARSGILVLFGLYLLKTGVRLSQDGFTAAFYCQGLLLIMLVQSVVSERGTLVDLYAISRVAFWMLGMVVFYRLFLGQNFAFKRLLAFYTAIVVSDAIAAVWYIGRVGDPHEAASHNVGAYLLLYAIPVFLVRPSWKFGWVPLVALGGIVLSLKRGPIVALACGAVPWYFISQKVAGKPSRRIQFALYFAIVAMVGACVVASRKDAFIERTAGIEERDVDKMSSGRTVLARVMFTSYLKGNAVQYLFGNGLGSAAQAYGEYRHGLPLSPHSDWILLLHDCGAIGVLLYIGYWLALWRKVREATTRKSELAPMMGFLVSMLVAASVYTTSLEGPNQVVPWIALSYAMAEVQKRSGG